MNITITGTGNMARGIGTPALAGGHNVTLVGHEPGKAEHLAAELQGVAQSDAPVRASAPGAPLGLLHIVVQSTRRRLRQCGQNPRLMRPWSLTGFGSSARSGGLCVY